jgi:hypothetical protein
MDFHATCNFLTWNQWPHRPRKSTLTGQREINITINNEDSYEKCLCKSFSTLEIMWKAKTDQFDSPCCFSRIWPDQHETANLAWISLTFRTIFLLH